MRKFTRSLTVFLAVSQLAMMPVHAQKNPKQFDTSKYDIQQLAFPSEVKNISKSAGAIYYSPSVKGKVLVPVHFWGTIGRPGLHFMPVDTTLIQGLSLAGGLNDNAVLDNVRLTRLENGEIKDKYFDLEEGGTNESYMEKLRPGDIVFVEQSRFYENRAYWTSLIGVVATFLSTVLLYREVKK